MFGLWWHPSTPDHRIAGKVIVNENVAWRLELQGSLFPPTDSITPTSALEVVEPCIRGLNEEGKSVTLFEAMHPVGQLGILAPSPDITIRGQEWYFKNYVVGSSHLTQDTTIERLVLHFDSLMEWCGDAQVHSPRLMLRPGDGYHGHDIEGIDGTTDEVRVEGSLVRLCVSGQTNWAPWSANYKSIAHFEIEDTCSIVDVWEKWVWPLRDMLISLTLGFVRVSHVMAILPDGDSPVELFANIKQPLDDVDTPRHGFKMLATIPKLRSAGVEFEQLFPKWFKLHQSEYFGHCLRVLADLHWDRNLLTDMQILQAFRAAEAYYRSKNEGKKPKKSSHAVRTLVEDSGSTGRSIESTQEDFVGFAARQRGAVGHVVDMHAGSRGEKFLVTSFGMRWMLRHIYLVQLGVSEDDASQLITRCDQFRQEIETMKRWPRE